MIQLIVKFMVALLLSVIFSVRADARMFATEIPIKAVCWDNVEEAVEYHQDILGEYPIGKGWVSEHAFGSIMYNPVKPSWTFLSFHKNDEGVEIMVCAITGGTEWMNLIPGDDEIEI